ncbi:BTA121 domain-containing protein surface lipoprotein [Borrelia anserina]|uniref:Uncharacterized protein n=1 Tax=Borrelia anserina BA2 TaxID=1313293 RepID=W5SQ76_BORAN|nr:hypothetical protein [Borrelia anserina]AHH09027.1 hypothetical protein BAN_0900029 [Borrelia anserina BA2]
MGKGINLSRKGVVEVDVGKSDLKKGTGENSVVKVDVGSEKVDAGSEKVDAGSEKVDAGSEKVDVGSEKVDAGSEKVDAGSEKVDAGSEKVDAGSEKVDAGSEKVDAGSKKVDAELEDDIELKIQNLLDEFKLSDQQRAIIMDLKDVLTNPDIGKDYRNYDYGEFYRTYSREKFYDLFNHTGNVNADLAFKLNFVNSVTQNILPTFQEQKEAKEAVGNLVEYVKNRVYWAGGQDLAERFTLKMKEYQLALKKIFNLDRNIHNHGFLISDLYGHCGFYESSFRDIKEKAVRIVELMKLREEIKPVINYMEAVLTNPDIGKGYRNYSDIEFDNLLVEFGAVKLKEIYNVLQVIVETEVAIDNINIEGIREALKRRFNDYRNLYSERLKETFSLDNVDDIYTDILRSHSNYLVDITKLQEEVPLIEKVEKK